MKRFLPNWWRRRSWSLAWRCCDWCDHARCGIDPSKCAGRCPHILCLIHDYDGPS